MVQKDPARIVKLPEPNRSGFSGKGFQIWYYDNVKAKHLDVKTINDLAGKTTVPQSFCKKTEMYSSTLDNLDKVAYKFNQLKQENVMTGTTKSRTSVTYKDWLIYDKVLTYN